MLLFVDFFPAARVFAPAHRRAQMGSVRVRKARRSAQSNRDAIELLLLVLLAILLFASTAVGAVPLSPEEQEIATRLVSDRDQRRDSREMTLDPILTTVARARAEDMAKRRYFAHVNPDGLGPNALVRGAGYVLPEWWSGSRAGNFIESIGAGYSTPAQAWDGWMNSKSHRTHLLATSSFYRNQTSFGVGYFSDPQSPFRRYWVIITAPPSRGAFVNLDPERNSMRIAVAMPASSSRRSKEKAGPPEVPSFIPGVPRPTVTKMAPATDRLWNWDESGDGRPVRKR